MSRTIKRLQPHQFAINLWFVLVSLAMIVPFWLVVAVSFTSEKSVLAHGYRLLPDRISLDAYRYLFASPAILLHAYGITILITVIGTAGGLLLTAMTAYGISRRDYRYNRITVFYVFFTMLFSGGLVPFYMLITQVLHLKDTLFALILPGLLSPFYIMLLRSFLLKLPMEIVESAKIDGAREWRIFFTIVLPLAKPALATLALFISFGYWNEWFNALLFIDDQRLVPLQLLLVRILNTIEYLTSNSQFTNGLNIDMSSFPNHGARMALAVLAGGPMIVVFPFFQKFFVRGLTVGSLKG
ncbi:MAG: carbohydrate ABC transporter permease [Paenibacillaceae bacterium]|nr:carbohydrate ABC transporter permease [Paenibacillaceae bacterium]